MSFDVVRAARAGRIWSLILILVICVFSLAAAGDLRSESGNVADVAWPKLPNAKFPLRLSDNRHYVVDGAGDPFMIRGDAAWSLVAQLTKEEAEVYLKDRKQRGFNLLMVNLIEHYYSDDAPQNAYGEPPFKRPGDFSQPNEAYFAHADWVLRRAAELGFAILLCPAYLGYEGNHEGWFSEMQQSGEPTLRAYGRFLGERYRDFANIIWLEGGDFTPPADGLALVNAVALAIRAAGANQLQAAHWDPETSAMDVSTGDWLDLNTTYTYKPVYLRSLVDDLRAERKPHFLIESAYEEEHGSTPRSLRGQVYYALLTGAFGDVFGQRWVWKFKKETLLRQLAHRWWQSGLDTPGTRGVEHARLLFASRSWVDLVPDVHNRVLVDGMGLHGGDLYALAAATPDGRLAIAYVPSGRSLAVNASTLALPARARWYDPTSGAFLDALTGPIESPAVVHFQTPAVNHAGDTDWVLVIEGTK
jgi:hypothetical protein